ncbi:protein phosphatase 2C domain-containing protein [Spirulina sp. CS-785/01]|uniref:PP2C family protein-serine/threonine phosphatase n=1 Tax=Spirulina sp. CS-785/01 TaxID=3021716 RepID=UPI00232DF4AD|nr:protein phosphatase 2C domain-containing protein [Spirulina sp. CS-785/01]MDB9315558.1 protein phosphatase 2C domain-containing protein [Spirulina sp. CS-785/01]
MSRWQSQHSQYLWAAGKIAAQLAPPNVIEGRYKVITPQVWQDIYPEQDPYLPDPIPDRLRAYLLLYPYRLHIPEVYGVCQVSGSSILLLQNVPIDAQGQLSPSLQEGWEDASPTRQLYWLWQILSLWSPLTEQGMAASLLYPENIRVEGWRIRLRELLSNPNAYGTSADQGQRSQKPTLVTLQQLGASWSLLARQAKAAIAPQLERFLGQMQQEDVSLRNLQTVFNKLLLQQAAQQSLRLQIASATDTGPLELKNEDSHYPTTQDLQDSRLQPVGDLNSHFFIVCDGIGGHEGGDVASNFAVSSLKLQVQALLGEILEDVNIMPPRSVEDHLIALLRIANNLICSRNDEQQRESRQRMATTVTLALQLPQKVRTPQSSTANSHELYIASVGDSRAYWITENYCQRLTVDDDVATREIRAGRAYPSKAVQRPDAGALTQALGTREASRLRPTVRRFLIDEDGILLLCSDGLSDNQLLEESWPSWAPKVLGGKLSLEGAIQQLMQMAYQRNGHDNCTVVAAFYGVSPQYPLLVNLPELSQEGETINLEIDPNFLSFNGNSNGKHEETSTVPPEELQQQEDFYLELEDHEVEEGNIAERSELGRETSNRNPYESPELERNIPDRTTYEPSEGEQESEAANIYDLDINLDFDERDIYGGEVEETEEREIYERSSPQRYEEEGEIEEGSLEKREEEAKAVPDYPPVAEKTSFQSGFEDAPELQEVDAWDDIQEVEDEYEVEAIEEWEETQPTRPLPIREMIVGVVLLVVFGGVLVVFWPQIAPQLPGRSPDSPSQTEE